MARHLLGQAKLTRDVPTREEIIDRELPTKKEHFTNHQTNQGGIRFAKLHDEYYALAPYALSSPLTDISETFVKIFQARAILFASACGA